MSRALLIRSIPLSRSTRDAWRAAGARFAKRVPDWNRPARIANGRPIINLGNQAYRPDTEYENTWNKADHVSVLLSPTASRDVLGELMPTNEWSGPGYYWTKGQGRGGVGKEKNWWQFNDMQHGFNVYVPSSARMGKDVQQHINGQEYRVITVGSQVVQVTKRDGENSDREYQWVGVSNAPLAVKAVARQAIENMQAEDNKLIVGWDIILGEYDMAYLLEGNACPGVNEATANRILDAVLGVEYVPTQ